MGRILPVIKAGFKWNVDKMPERNAAISYLMKNAIRGEKPDLHIDYAAVLVARGNLSPPKKATAGRISEKILEIQWNFDSALGTPRGDDNVLALAYFPDIKQGVWSIDGSAIRADEKITLELPDGTVDKAMHIYLAFADPESNDASDSVYVGKA